MSFIQKVFYFTLLDTFFVYFSQIFLFVYGIIPFIFVLIGFLMNYEKFNFIFEAHGKKITLFLFFKVIILL